MSFLYTHPDTDLQKPFDAAIVIPTTMRPSLSRALTSIYGQWFPGRVHLLIGIDANADKRSLIDISSLSRPSNITVTVFWPGYSTAVRHGGLTSASDGGALRTILTNLANSPYVAYLDDDDFWAPSHLHSLKRAIEGVGWTYSLRQYCHPATGQPICVDEWESVGPDKGFSAEQFGGYSAPSTLMIDKTRCGLVPQLWCHPMVYNDPMTADRRVFDGLRQFTSCGTKQPTSFYTINPADPMHPQRREWMGSAYEEAGQMEPIEGYVGNIMARAEAYRARKAEQEAEATRLKDEALADAAAYAAKLELVETPDE